MLEMLEVLKCPLLKNMNHEEQMTTLGFLLRFKTILILPPLLYPLPLVLYSSNEYEKSFLIQSIRLVSNLHMLLFPKKKRDEKRKESRHIENMRL